MPLYPFQVAGALRMVRDKRLILADDMGLGKTVQAIAALQRLGCPRILLVAPRTLALNWQREFEQWAGIPVHCSREGNSVADRVEAISILRKTQRDQAQAVYCVNYEMLRYGSDSQVAIAKMPWDALVCDESHRYLCNRKSTNTKGLVTLAWHTPVCFFLSGTPMRNAVTDIWPLLYMLDKPNFKSYWRFAKEHVQIDKPGLDENGKPTYGWRVGREAKNPTRLAAQLAPYMLRRTKDQVLDLPPKVYQEVWLEMTGEQKRLYADIEREMMALLDNQPDRPPEFLLAPGALAQVTRLKQIATSPRLVGGKDDGVKLEALRGLLEDVAGKVVIASQWVRMLELIHQVGIGGLGDAVFLTGEMTPQARQAAVARFQEDPTCRYFLCSIMAGGVGVTLTAASYLIFTDRMWTPADNEQMVDRVYRIGQAKPVTIIDLLAKGHVERRVDALLAEKTKAIEAVIGTTSTRFSKDFVKKG